MAEPRVILLGGLGRSGTTLVERILGELPGAVALGEIVHLWRRDMRDNERCACGEQFQRLPVLAEVGALAFGGWDKVDVTRVEALQEAVERTRYIPKLGRGRLPGPRCAPTCSRTPSYYAKVYRAAAERGRRRAW